MQNASTKEAPWAEMAAVALGLERRYGFGRLKRGMIAMLAAWLGFFLIINMSVRTLNQVMVPVLDMPLGFFLAMQGTAIIFLSALILLVKKSRDVSTPPAG